MCTSNVKPATCQTHLFVPRVFSNELNAHFHIILRTFCSALMNFACIVNNIHFVADLIACCMITLVENYPKFCICGSKRQC
jgi:hypothetical protein